MKSLQSLSAFIIACCWYLAHAVNELWHAIENSNAIIMVVVVMTVMLLPRSYSNLSVFAVALVGSEEKRASG